MTTANRLLWTIVGFVLLAAGVVGLLINAGRFRWVPSSTAVLPTSFTNAWNRFGFWSPLVTIVVGLLLVALGFLLLRAELRRRGARAMTPLVVRSTVRVDTPAIAIGTTRIGTGALEKALARDVARSRQVSDATAYLTGDRDHPTLRLRLAVAPGADLRRVKSDVDSALDRFAATSGLRPRLADVDVQVEPAPATTDHPRVA